MRATRLGRRGRGMLALLLGLVAALVAVRPAGAHPLGNFTINHYSAITVGSTSVAVRYVLDLAEIPTFQELGEIRADHSTELTAAERDAYLARKVPEILAALRLTLDDKPLTLQPVARSLSFPPGAGGLFTLRLVLDLQAPLTVRSGTLRYHDGYLPDRAGWREIIANPGPGVGLNKATVPTTDRSHELTSYDKDMLTSPPQVAEAMIPFAPGTGPTAGSTTIAPIVPPASDPLSKWAADLTEQMKTLLARKEFSLEIILGGLLLAFAMGAAHALSPGHGKAVVAAYLVGSRGTPMHAVLLGLTVTITHTIGVFLFGLIILGAAQYIVPEQLYPWLGFLSGAMIVVVGLALVAQRGRPLWRAWRARVRRPVAALQLASATGGLSAPFTAGHDSARPDHDHADDYSDVIQHDDGTHSHGFGSAHSHLPPSGQPVTINSLLALGISGGIIPCPNAVVVLLSAFTLHRLDVGLVMLLAFSAGLAVVLTAIGLLMVYARPFFVRLPLESRLLGPLGVLSALLVAGLGVTIAVSSLVSGGVLKF